MPNGLLDLSNDLLAHICSYAMIYEPLPVERRQSSNNHPKGMIGDQPSKKLRQLLIPMRSCRRLYVPARHEFLESNVIVLDLSDIRMGACRLEHQPAIGQLLYTGNLDPLLARLVHVQVTISVSDTRMRYSLAREAANLRELVMLCRHLKTLHTFLKVDAWFASETDLDIQSTLRNQPSDADVRFRNHAEAVVVLLKDMHIKVVTVAFHEWVSDVDELDARHLDPRAVIDSLLDSKGTGSLSVRSVRRIARVRSGGARPSTGRERIVKVSWGTSDDICRATT